MARQGFIKIPRKLLAGWSCGTDAFYLYCVLLEQSTFKGVRVSKGDALSEGETNVSTSELCELTGFSRKHLVATRNLLIAAGLIEVIERKAPRASITVVGSRREPIVGSQRKPISVADGNQSLVADEHQVGSQRKPILVANGNQSHLIYNTRMIYRMSSTARARTREGDKNFSFVEELKKHPRLIEIFVMNEKTTVERYWELAGAVMNEWAMQQKEHEDYQDFVKHLNNTIRIKLQIDRRNGKTWDSIDKKERERAERGAAVAERIAANIGAGAASEGQGVGRDGASNPLEYFDSAALD